MGAKPMDLLKTWLKFVCDGIGQVLTSHSFKYKNLEGYIIDNYDSTGKLALIYAKSEFECMLKNHKVSWYDVFNSKENYSEIKAINDMFNGVAVRDIENEFIQSIVSMVEKVAPSNRIGEIDWAQEGRVISESLKDAIEAVKKCSYDCYLKGGRVDNIQNISTKIQVFGNIAECVLSIEKAPDGMYVCYITNGGKATGFFGIFAKSNGTILSINERIFEAYSGQISKLRNARYSNSKQYEFFPYDYIFTWESHDYKGIANKHLINEDMLDFFRLQPEAYLRLLLGMLLAKSRFEKSQDEADLVYVDKLSHIGIMSELPVQFKNSAVIEFNMNLDIQYTSEDILMNAPGAAMSYGTKGLKHGEAGQFKDLNKELVGLYGSGFNYDPTQGIKNFELLGGECSEYDCLIGSEKFLKLQVYYNARKQLADYIKKQIDEEYKKFGCDDIIKWYYSNMKNCYKVYDLIYQFETNSAAAKDASEGTSEGALGDADKNAHGNACGDTDKNACGDTGKDAHGSAGKDACGISITKSDKCTISQKMNDRNIKGQSICAITGCKCSVWYRFQPNDWHDIEYLLGDVPKIIKGWRSSDFGFELGNPSLSAVDPVSTLRMPYEIKFDFEVGLSVRGLKKLMRIGYAIEN